MSIYIISSCFLRNVTSKIHITEVLLKFTQLNEYKVGIDTQKKIIDIYSEVAENKPEVAYWLQLMSHEPTSFEEICELRPDIIIEIEKYLFLAKSIVNKKNLIVYSYQSLDGFKFSESNKLEYEESMINVFDRDSAINEFSDTQAILIKNSIIATNGSKISKVKK